MAASATISSASLARAAVLAIPGVSAVDVTLSARVREAVGGDGPRQAVPGVKNIIAVGAGKGGASMAKGAERVLGRRITRGLINVKDGHVEKLRRIELHEGRLAETSRIQR